MDVAGRIARNVGLVVHELNEKGRSLDAIGVTNARSIGPRPAEIDAVVTGLFNLMQPPMLLGFRLTEYALHGWDLARAVDADDTIDVAVLEALWEFMAPLVPVMELVTLSVAVTVRLPALLSVTPREKAWTPASSAVNA